jgi:hypothetical protein
LSSPEFGAKKSGQAEKFSLVLARAAPYLKQNGQAPGPGLLDLELVAGARSAPNALVIPFRIKLFRPAV